MSTKPLFNVKLKKDSKLLQVYLLTIPTPTEKHIWCNGVMVIIKLIHILKMSFDFIDQAPGEDSAPGEFLNIN